ncbi:acetyltransferase domain-containing protein, putative [Eimeria maxima]|uniref:Acetyltransferase domain-containing protein, putative n=1 Tax=Eimeria maxima TaxID=5804 RepID=U6M428_EIMMA|nr:acetyltransferase domain-containing protein, putative [Eimeria maxima]CDJ57823.1 acetyltransferase domain-containing protein, putative [Eimeria maxima]
MGAPKLSKREGPQLPKTGGPPVGVSEAAKDPLAAFLHFRFEVEERQPVVYLYELQIKEEYTSDESCPYWLLQQHMQQQQQQLVAADSSSEEEEPEYEILKKEIIP